MPGYLTHLLFGRQAVHKLKDLPLPSDMLDVILTYPHAFNIGAQGPDLFFYDLSCNLNPKRKLGSLMHHTKTDEYFRCCLDFLEKSNIKERKEIFTSYLAGLICHYTLDCATHPFIYWQTHYDIHSSGGLGYLATHCQYESNLDSLMLRHLKHRVPSDYNAARFIKLTKKEAVLLGKCLSDTITATYFPDNPSAYSTPSFMKKALSSMSWKVAFLTDHGGPKRKPIELLETCTVRAHFLTSLFTIDQVKDGTDYLNKKNSLWKNPWDPFSQSNDSFIALYQKALSTVLERLKLLSCYYHSLSITSGDQARKEQYRKDLLDDLKDHSYNTGRSCCL
ncbi:MAG: zinc dependent phospholipase C family protein [bacterium]|nr:zinc dependent phospholipase C family protein [bacterium]